MKKWEKLIGICLILALMGYLWFQSWESDKRALFYSGSSSFDEPIFSGVIDLSKKGERIKIPVTPKYDGRYFVDTLVPVRLSDDALDHQEGLLRINLHCHNFPRLSFCNSEHYPSTYQHDDRTELGLFDIYITKDLLRCPNLELEIEVVKPYKNLKTSEPIRIWIQPTYLL